MAKAEGKRYPFKGVEHIDSSVLETFEFDSINQKIEINTHEFSAVCPFSGLPDIAKVKIQYIPTQNKCIELKSLKYYFMSFRDVGIYQEAVTARIYKDLCQVIYAPFEYGPLRVETVYNTRGGIDVICEEGQIL